ncbi:MAG: YbhB/YbcL family Raf kinase inhibitor-like protein [Proteobacteria bacterium]|nr:YbhB/YbcL family Raf kinase inhibitor-like protein [Pseudomonadota bacterium]
MPFILTSTAFKEGERIPKTYTCEGADVSPPLAWSGAPAGTKSFALLCDDPDAPRGTWRHWGVFDVPAATSRLDEGYPKDARVGPARQAVTDFGRTGYGGPCPPKGHGTHHYQFRLLALKVDKLPLPDRATCVDLERAARPQALGEGRLMGTYSR